MMVNKGEEDNYKVNVNNVTDNKVDVSMPPKVAGHVPFNVLIEN